MTYHSNFTLPNNILLTTVSAPCSSNFEGDDALRGRTHCTNTPNAAESQQTTITEAPPAISTFLSGSAGVRVRVRVVIGTSWFWGYGIVDLKSEARPGDVIRCLVMVERALAG
jgi:hypothetical protein